MLPKREPGKTYRDVASFDQTQELDVKRYIREQDEAKQLPIWYEAVAACRRLLGRNDV